MGNGAVQHCKKFELGMHIIYIIPSLIKAGPENVLYDIVSNLDLNKYEVTIITLKKTSGIRSRLADFNVLNIRIIECTFNNLQLELFPLYVARKIKKLLPPLTDNCIVHAHCYHPVLICSYFRNYKKIVTIHNISIEDFSMLKGKMLGRYMSFRFNHALKEFSRCVVISDSMYEYYKIYCSELPTKINNGVSDDKNLTSEYRALEQEKQMIKRKFILVSGRLSKRKNVHFIISELKKLTRDDFVCQFVGLGEEMDSCKNQIGMDERFRILGYKENVQDYLAVTDLYISASLSEGFPLSVIEALMMGIPSFLSAIPPHIEIADNMNVDDIKLFELKDGCLCELLDNWIDRLQQSSVISNRARELYSAETMANKYMALYSSIKE